ncbi:MAG: hypothetical protein NTW28_01780, partial [Candidatus Solibacter sp.]|nr:hypothetical protein [Candidatus Solibacter sp.]
MNDAAGQSSGIPQVKTTALQLEVRGLDEIDYVMRHPDSTPFHLLAWKRTIEESFKYRALYLVTTDGECIRGVLPVFLVENLIIGKALISSPFAVYGGILADSEQALHSLHDHVLKLGSRLGVDYIELRNSRRE